MKIRPVHPWACRFYNFPTRGGLSRASGSSTSRGCTNAYLTDQTPQTLRHGNKLELVNLTLLCYCRIKDISEYASSPSNCWETALWCSVAPCFFRVRLSWWVAPAGAQLGEVWRTGIKNGRGNIFLKTRKDVSLRMSLILFTLQQEREKQKFSRQDPIVT